MEIPRSPPGQPLLTTLREDLRIDSADLTRPAILFFLIEKDNPDQASQKLVEMLRNQIELALTNYNARPSPGKCPTALTFGDIQQHFLRPALATGKEHWRTLVTTLISFFLEWAHRSRLIELRTELGTAEPFFARLFKGCVLFESLLKENPRRAPTNKMLGPILNELQSDLEFSGQPSPATGGFDFQTIITDLRSDGSSVYVAVERTGRIRNTTGHNFGWRAPLASTLLP
jgi:hypothetical protein